MTAVTLPPGPHDLCMDYFNGAGPSSARLLWSTANNTQTVPANALSTWTTESEAPAISAIADLQVVP
jgi:hypothetical protein